MKLHSDDLGELFKALSLAQENYETCEHSRENTFHRNKYATLDDVMRAVRPALKENNIAISQYDEVENGKNVLVTIMVHHPSGQWIKSRTLLELDVNDKNILQALGKARKYCMRYDYSAITGLIITGDDDGDGEPERVSVLEVENLKKEMANREDILTRLISHYKIPSLNMMLKKDYNQALSLIRKAKAQA